MPCAHRVVNRGTRTAKARCESRGFLPVGAIKARFGVGYGGATGAARPSPVKRCAQPRRGTLPPRNPAPGLSLGRQIPRPGLCGAVGRGSFMKHL